MEQKIQKAYAAAPKTWLWQLLAAFVVACLLAIVIALVPIRWPGVLRETCQTLGAITTPAALLIIGATLAGMPLRLLAGSPRLYALCALCVLGLEGFLLLGELFPLVV